MGPHDEIIVVDDGSRRSPRDIVEACGDERVRLVEMGVNRGRGPARNAGLAAARHRCAVLLDADVVPHADAIDRLRRRLDEGSVAVFGSYDDRPGDPGVVSQYRNLLHHVTHRDAGSTADHLFAGLAAVDTDVVRGVGGFDEHRWARDIEDVELGYRLMAAGHRIDVEPSAQGTHLKPYTLRSLVSIDLFDRAIPWTRLMLEKGAGSNRFVTGRHRLVSAGSAVTALVAVLPATKNPAARFVLVGSSVVFLIANRRLFELLLRRGGVRLAAVSIPLHMLHTSVGVAGGVIGMLGHLRELARRRHTDR